MKAKFGNKIRRLREQKKLLLREVAALLDIDPAQLSKIERGERCAKRETVIHIASILDIKSDDLLPLWLADQICEIVKNEKNALLAMMIAEENVKYLESN